MNPSVIQWNEDNFSQVERYHGVAVVRFHAPWCGTCQSSESLFLQAADRLPSDVLVGTVNVVQAPVLAAKYSVWGLPNTLVFRDGQVVERLSGPQTFSAILAAIIRAQALI
ncbi:TPA: thioredoxin [Klebsiella aerogenes]|nr:thioredoxin [Klebsiella aerogenes]